MNTVAVFGGTAPLVIAWSSETGRGGWFFVYVAGAAVVAFLTVLTLRESKDEVLR